jgi:hypothetical protein
VNMAMNPRFPYRAGNGLISYMTLYSEELFFISVRFTLSRLTQFQRPRNLTDITTAIITHGTGSSYTNTHIQHSHAHMHIHSACLVDSTAVTDVHRSEANIMRQCFEVYFKTRRKRCDST